MFLFSAGVMWGTPLTDVSGAAVSNPTPLIFGTMQDVEIDFKFETKEMHGQKTFPVAVGRGKGSIGGKAKLADLRAGFLETIALGASGANGMTSAVYDTVGTAIPSSPNTITVTPPNSGTWQGDHGVINASTGRELKRVGSGPTTGQYSVSAGIYTFAAADAGQTVFVNYRYTATSTTARNLTGNNELMGQAPSFRGDFYLTFQGKTLMLTLHNCVAEGIKVSSKNDDFAVPEFGFKAFANAAGQVYSWSMTE